MQSIILCDGRAPSANQIRKYIRQSKLFVAADGGGNLARELNLAPHFVIGDLDSYISRPGDTAEVIRDPDQNTNDLEKALRFVLDRGSTDAIVFGAVGKRLDHTLKNLSVLKQFHTYFRTIKFIDRYGELFLLPRIYKTVIEPGTVVSLFPLSGKVIGITTTGLKYPLNNEALENGVRDGTSNEATSDHIEITYKKGDLLLFIYSPKKNDP